MVRPQEEFQGGPLQDEAHKGSEARQEGFLKERAKAEQQFASRVTGKTGIPFMPLLVGRPRITLEGAMWLLLLNLFQARFSCHCNFEETCH